MGDLDYFKDKYDRCAKESETYDWVRYGHELTVRIFDGKIIKWKKFDMHIEVTNAKD